MKKAIAAVPAIALVIVVVNSDAPVYYQISTLASATLVPPPTRRPGMPLPASAGKALRANINNTNAAIICIAPRLRVSPNLAFRYGKDKGIVTELLSVVMLSSIA